MSGSVLAPQRATFRAFAEAVVPEMARLDEAGWAEVEATIEHVLAQRPQRMRRQLGLLLRIIGGLPRLTHTRSFAALDRTARHRIIERMEQSPLMLVRRGVWGLRTLVLMGYYTRQDTMNAVGYRAHVSGWEMRRPGIA